MASKRQRVGVGLSGGVDSSVAAALLMLKGYDLIGITMEIFDDSFELKKTGRHACYGPDEKEDIKFAASVCNKLNIPFYVIDLKEEYKNHVIEYFRSEYLIGRTPNPCIVCNKIIKFGILQKKAETAFDFDFFATGHYARVVESSGRFLLKRPVYLSKDQTYFLYALTPKQLSKTLFPLGEYNKQQVRAIACSLELETSERPESQDFIAGNDYSTLFANDEIREGEIVDEQGNLLGKHRGIIHYTVGQRRGLNIASSHPYYVVKIDANKNRIVVGDKENLLSKALIATDLNLLSIDVLDRPHKIKAKIRLNHKEADAEILPYAYSKAKVIFNEPQLSVTPGQAVVFYEDDVVLGGGIIEEAR